ncbi:MAG: cyclodeaminase/cyclohydrolase family protein [Treponema sp.]
MKLVDMLVHGFIEETASSSPAPGGGSVSALLGALSSSLGQMVIRLTSGKKSFNELDESIKTHLLEDLKTLENHQNTLVRLIDEDTDAFNDYMEALKLPKETDEQKAKRKKAMSDAIIVAMKVPLKTAETSLEILKILPLIAKHGNKNAASDVGVASLCARSALEGAILNVKINLGGIDDEAICKEKRDVCNNMLREGEALKEEILKEIYKKIE